MFLVSKYYYLQLYILYKNLEDNTYPLRKNYVTNYLDLETRLNANNEPAANNTDAITVIKLELDCSPVSGNALACDWFGVVFCACSSLF